MKSKYSVPYLQKSLNWQSEKNYPGLMIDHHSCILLHIISSSWEENKQIETSRQSEFKFYQNLRMNCIGIFVRLVPVTVIQKKTTMNFKWLLNHHRWLKVLFNLLWNSAAWSVNFRNSQFITSQFSWSMTWALWTFFLQLIHL